MSTPQPLPGFPVPQSPAEWFYLALCLADVAVCGLPVSAADEQRRIAKCKRMAAHFWPLVYYQIHGIASGLQWDRLGWLAARYARDFDTGELADELRAVMEACPQDRRNPWRHSHATAMAVRAHRFISQADAAQRAGMADAMAYFKRAEIRWAAEAAQARDRTRFERWARRGVSS